VSVILQEKKELEELFQFEKKNYSIKEGKTKKIRVFAKWPEFINGRVKLKVFSENEKYFKILNKSVILDYDNKAIKDFRKRIASATVLIKGIKYGKSTKIFIELQDQKISTTVRVIPQKEIGANFRIEIANVDLGSQRSVLVGNLLKINGRHKIIQRYLGPEDKWNKNQNSIHFRLLIAELVADTVARMILEESSQKHREEYESLAVSSLYQKHREYMNRFLEIAHKNQIPDRDLTVG
ncbi:hypothetical protein KKG58_01645, partial [Patescibacteria group bacterium]|nr:hypothetical protein [Patescibacteria group bacterium]